MTAPRILIHVQHLLGTGHIVRAAALGRALAAEGAAVTLMSGNRVPENLPTSGMDVIELPPLKAKDATFRTLVHLDGTPIEKDWKQARAKKVLEIFDRTAPEVLLTEAFPLARRSLRFELIPLLERAAARNPRPLIAASVRDILVIKDDPEKDRWMADRTQRYYDLLLIHGDPAVIRLNHSFPLTHEIENLLAYSGYVASGTEAPQPPGDDGRDEIIVSCSGGNVGRELLSAAIGAYTHSGDSSRHRWRILVSGGIDEETFQTLRQNSRDGLIVERARPDYPQLLKRARLSVSQAGYNTVVDVLEAEVAAVLVPYSEAEENEQARRADILHEKGLAIALPERRLTAESLAEAIDRALRLRPGRGGIALDGARRSAQILLDRLGRKIGRREQ